MEEESHRLTKELDEMREEDMKIQGESDRFEGELELRSTSGLIFVKGTPSIQVE